MGKRSSHVLYCFDCKFVAHCAGPPADPGRTCCRGGCRREAQKLSQKGDFDQKNSGLLINRALIVLRPNLLWRKPMCDGSQGVRVGHGPRVLVMLCWRGIVMSYLLFPLTLPLCVLYIDLCL
jgi:hypothetical protein